MTDALGIDRKSSDGTTDGPGAGGAGLTAVLRTAQAPAAGKSPEAGTAAGAVPSGPAQSAPAAPQNRVGAPSSASGATQPPAVRPGGAGPIPASVGAAVGTGVASASGKPETVAGAKPKPTASRRTRKARLRLSRLDPWSVMKTSFLFSIAAGIMFVVAVYAVWAVLSTSGLFASINDIVASVVSTPGDTTPFRVEDYLGTQRIMGVTALVACVDVVIFTALATLGSFLYNLAATMLGGLEITLAED